MKNNKKIVNVTTIIVIMIIIITIWQCFKIVDTPLKIKDEEIIEVAEGDSFYGVLNKLSEEDKIKNEFLVKLYLKIRGIKPEVLAGTYKLDNSMTLDEIIDFVDMTKNKAVDVRFIELMPIGIAVNYKGVTNEEILATIKEHYKEVIEVKRSKMGGPATYVKLNEAKGKIGFISAMSNCFCEDCNRIRLTPEGFLKQCLHFDYGVDLRKLMRDGISDEELKKVIYHNIYDKPEKHLFLEKCEHKEIKFMNQIGG